MSEMTVNSKSITHLNAFFLVFTSALKDFYWKVLLSYIKHASMYLEKYRVSICLLLLTQTINPEHR